MVKRGHAVRNSKFDTVVDVDTRLKEIKIFKPLNKCASLSELPSNISTRYNQTMCGSGKTRNQKSISNQIQTGAYSDF